jgi:hypothetical protein
MLSYNQAPPHRSQTLRRTTGSSRSRQQLTAVASICGGVYNLRYVSSCENTTETFNKFARIVAPNATYANAALMPECPPGSEGRRIVATANGDAVGPFRSQVLPHFGKMLAFFKSETCWIPSTEHCAPLNDMSVPCLTSQHRLPHSVSYLQVSQCLGRFEYIGPFDRLPRRLS